MNSDMMEKTLDTLSNASKIAANLTEKKEPPKVNMDQRDDSNNASTGSQSVNIVVDHGKKKEPKPVEKHIHEFPDNRPMTDAECELALKRAQMDYELRKSQQEHEHKMDNQNWQHKLEQEKKFEKRRKITNVVFGVVATAIFGAIGWGFWRDYQDQKAADAAAKALPPAAGPSKEPVKVDATVE